MDFEFGFFFQNRYWVCNYFIIQLDSFLRLVVVIAGVGALQTSVLGSTSVFGELIVLLGSYGR